MIYILAGLILWSGVHFWKRIASKERAKFGEKGKLIVALGSVLAIVLMVIGYKVADGTFYWAGSPALTGINNLLMVASFYIYATGAPAPGRPRAWVGRKLRHPQLIGFSVWAAAHLLVNGDTPSFLLFGGLLAWALAEILIINRAEPTWTPAPSGGPRKELVPVIATFVLLIIVMLIHNWLGVRPWG